MLRLTEPTGVIVAAMAVVSAGCQVGSGEERTQHFAVAILMFVGLLLLASLAYAFAGSFGARPAWPIYAILADPILAIAWNHMRAKLSF